jgi:hypothetical protein
MVEQMKKLTSLSVGMKMLLGAVVCGTIFLGYEGTLKGDQIVGLFMAVILLAQNIVKGDANAEK